MTTYPDILMLIGGNFRAGQGVDRLPVTNPSTGAVLGHIPAASAEDTAQAIDAAHRAFPLWRDTHPGKRTAILRRAAALIRSRDAELSRLMALELGKPVSQGPAEVGRAAEHFEFHAEQALRTLGEVVPGPAGLQQTTLRVPVGPVAAFTPWNGPVASPARKIAAALAAGCSIVIKPAEETPACAVIIAECLQEAGLPEGVLNMLFGQPQQISQALISDPRMRMLTFTGSVPVGRSLAVAAGQYLKPCILELGGHSPVIVCADADPHAVARQAVVAKYRNSGQICISPTRFLVHDTIFDTFTQALTEAAEALTVGDPLDAATQMGPLIHDRRLQAVHALIRDAVDKGATLCTGGHPVGSEGSFYAPTVLSDLSEDAAILTEEPFGPVALVQRFTDLDDACVRANATAYGLAAYAFTNATDAAATITRRVETGILSINHFGGANPEVPFGGVKDSGYGREGGSHCFDGYLVPKAVSRKTHAA